MLTCWRVPRCWSADQKTPASATHHASFSTEIICFFKQKAKIIQLSLLLRFYNWLHRISGLELCMSKKSQTSTLICFFNLFFLVSFIYYSFTCFIFNQGTISLGKAMLHLRGRALMGIMYLVCSNYCIYTPFSVFWPIQTLNRQKIIMWDFIF